MLLYWLSVFCALGVQCDNSTQGQPGDGDSIFIAPYVTPFGQVTLYSLDHSGIFHLRGHPSPFQKGQVTYSVLSNGILTTKPGSYSISYKVSRYGDLIPLPFNKCIYKSDKPALYLEGYNRMLIPVKIYYNGDRVHYVFEDHKLLYSEQIDKSAYSSHWLRDVNEEGQRSLQLRKIPIVPDKNCNGDITLFLLKSDGIFARNPPDEFLPNGQRIRYDLQGNGVLLPNSRSGVGLTFVTAENGNLQPSSNNTHTLTTLKETTKSFILGEGGVLAPVNELMAVNKTIDYFFDGRLIHSSKQFREIYGNSSIYVLSEKNRERQDTRLDSIRSGPKFVCPQRKICKRDVESLPPEECDTTCPSKPCTRDCTFLYDDNGRRISLEPLITDCGNIALYKLTCKGHLKRLTPAKEPEYGFEIQFKILDNLILVPIRKCSNKLLLKYTLMENGNLVPVPRQKNSLKKAPASMTYYILSKNKELIPVRVRILKTNEIQFYFEDCLVYTMSPESGKDLELFTTLYVPLFAYVNGYIVLGCSEPITKPCNGATWNNPDRSDQHLSRPTKNLYLVGPNGLKIQIIPYMNKNGVPVVFDLDCNGVCHRSPKEENKNMVLKSYKFLKEGILLPTNDTNGYIYLVDKQGNMLPYCYPESKLRAPFALTVKYIKCLEGVLLPILVESLGDIVQFSYENIVVYRRKLWTVEQILELSTEFDSKSEEDDVKFYKDKDGNIAYFEIVDNLFKRCPSQQVEKYLVHTLGYFKISDNGVLLQTQYPQSTCEYIKVMVEECGDLSILPGGAKLPCHKDYVMDEKGNLLPVEVRRKCSVINVYYKNQRIGSVNCTTPTKVCDIKLDDTPLCTPSGKDPMGILKDPPPKEKKENDDPEYIQIPVKGIRSKNKDKNLNAQCENVRKTIKDMLCRDPSIMNVELEVPDHVMDEIYKLAQCCSQKPKCDGSSKEKEKRSCFTKDSSQEEYGDPEDNF